MATKPDQRTIEIRHDDAGYQKLLTKKPEVSRKEFKPADLASAKDGIYILTGSKTKEFGGGPSPDGFIIDGTKVLGRIGLAKAGLLGKKQVTLK